MPNWCYNSLYFKKSDMDKVLRFNESEDSYDVDFELICPMPESLSVTSGSNNERDIYIYVSNKLDLSYDETMEKMVSMGLENKAYYPKLSIALGHRPLESAFNRASELLLSEDEEAFESAYKMGEALVNNIKEYGAMTWYEWHNENWGCKWNARNTMLETECDDDNYMVISFETPWGPPDAWCRKLADLVEYFDLEWEEESGFRGDISGGNGEMTSIELEAVVYDDEFDVEDDNDNDDINDDYDSDNLYN